MVPVTTQVVPAQNYTYNSTNTTQNYSDYETQPASFSQRHPILAGLGIGTLVLGAAALSFLGDDDDYYRYDRRPPPPPPRHRGNGHHQPH